MLRGFFVLFCFFLKAQVVADRDSHVYIHLILIDPARVFSERGERFPGFSLSLVEDCHAIWNKAVCSFTKAVKLITDQFQQRWLRTMEGPLPCSKPLLPHWPGLT